MPTRKKSATRPNSIAAANGLLRGARAAIDRPIGVFDSGIGGLTVLKALTAALPNEDFIYLGDTARLPYGTKSNEVIVRYSKENTGFLLAKGIKMLVVACNTSSAVALDAIASDTMIPVIGVIEPGARAAVKASRNGKIGVIGTEATIASGAYTRAIQRLSPSCEIYTRACPLLVPLAEEGWTDNAVAELTVAHYLESLKQKRPSQLPLWGGSLTPAPRAFRPRRPQISRPAGRIRGPHRALATPGLSF